MKCARCSRESFDPTADGWVRITFRGLDIPESWICAPDMMLQYRREAERANALWEKDFKRSIEREKKFSEMVTFSSILFIIGMVVSNLFTGLVFYYSLL